MTSMMIPTTIKAIIVVILMIEDQNSNSPNNFAVIKFIVISTSIVNSAVIQVGISGNQKLMYFATSVTSAMPVTIQQNQYVQPLMYLANGPIYVCVMSANE